MEQPRGHWGERTWYLLRSSDDSAALMMMRRWLDDAVKCALRLFRLDDDTSDRGSILG